MYHCGFFTPGRKKVSYEALLPAPIPVGTRLSIREDGRPPWMEEGEWVGGMPDADVTYQIYTVAEQRWTLSGVLTLDPRRETSTTPSEVPEGTIYVLHRLE